ncbi:MAG: hypothetical protein KC620_16755 [Myxococcales bacterium]|nr:hypothetical protein [Myxococcales bacterium]
MRVLTLMALLLAFAALTPACGSNPDKPDTSRDDLRDRANREQGDLNNKLK